MERDRKGRLIRKPKDAVKGTALVDLKEVNELEADALKLKDLKERYDSYLKELEKIHSEIKRSIKIGDDDTTLRALAQSRRCEEELCRIFQEIRTLSRLDETLNFMSRVINRAASQNRSVSWALYDIVLEDIEKAQGQNRSSERKI